MSDKILCAKCGAVAPQHADWCEIAPPKHSLDKANKADEGKSMVELLPFEALVQVGQVLSFGAQKYAAHNWRKGMKWSRLLGAAIRHLFAWGRGETTDPESGLPHLAHAACCVLFLLSYEVTKTGEDDRYVV